MGLFSMFNKKNSEVEDKLNKEILELKETIQRKDKEISSLVNEVETLNQNTSNINNKQMELIEKNLKETKEENKRLRKVIEEYQLSTKKEKHYYKVDIESFFSASKFKDLVAFIKGMNIEYIQDMSIEILNKIPEDIKNLEDGKIKFEKFINKEFIEWEIVTYLNKGEKASRIYSKSRKFMNILVDEDIEFMEDMINYDFSKLLEKGFNPEQIQEFKDKRDSYYQERRVTN